MSFNYQFEIFDLTRPEIESGPPRHGAGLTSGPINNINLTLIQRLVLSGILKKKIVYRFCSKMYASVFSIGFRTFP